MVHGFNLAPLILVAPLMRRKHRKIVLQPVECFRGVLAVPLLCCSVQKVSLEVSKMAVGAEIR